jgi:photosystem II stability/assembly factor-like uncharacterized protein
MKYHRACAAFSTFVLVLVVLASAFASVAAAADSIVFLDAQRGWRTTFEGDPSTNGGHAFLWRTADGGDTWKRLATKAPGYHPGSGYNGGVLAFRNADLGLWGRYAWDRLLRTTRRGVSWKSSGRMTKSIVWDFCFGSARVAWACSGVGSAGDGGEIMKSADGGATWRVLRRYRTVAGQAPAGAFYQISSPTARHCFVAGGGDRLGGLWATSDGGVHWARRRLPGAVGGAYVIEFPTASTGWNVGYDGAIYKTASSGRSWSRQATAGRPLNDVSFLDELHGWVVGDDGAVLRTVDGGANWEWLYPGTDASLSEVVFVDDLHGWAAGRAGEWPDYWDVLLRTTDGGDTWTELP